MSTGPFAFRSAAGALVAAAAAAALPAIDHLGSDFESASRPVQLGGITGIAGADISVYSMKRRWRGVDVYIAPNDPTGGFFVGPFATNVEPSLAVLVFGVVAGQRILVGSGRLSLADVVTGRPILPKHVCSVHDVGAERFDVAISLVGMGPGTISATAAVQVNVFGSDEVAPRPTANVGTVRGFRALDASGSGVRLVSGGGATSDVLELVGAMGIAPVAGRHLHIYDSTAVGAALNGLAPLFAWELPHSGAVNAPSLFDVNDAMRAYRFRFGISCVISSTPLTTTAAAANDAGFQVFYR